MHRFNRSFLLLLSILIGTFGSLKAQNPRLYTAEQGLSSSRIRSIYQDSNGFIWVCGENGLNRLNGDNIVSFLNNHENPWSIKSNEIKDIYMDSENHYWVGTGKGLNRFIREKNKFEQIKLSEFEKPELGFSISNIIPYSEPGKIVLSTGGHGVFVLNVKDASVDQKTTDQLNNSFKNSFVSNLYIDQRNWLWAWARDEGFCVLDLKTKKRVRLKIDAAVHDNLSNIQVTSIKMDTKTGNILISTSNNGLFIFDKSLKSIRKTRDENLNQINIQSMLVTKDGRILIGAENRGLWEFDRITESIHPYIVHNSTVDLEHSKVHSLLEDSEGNLWAGLYQKGLFIIPKSISGFEYHAISDDKSGKNRACISSFTRDFRGNLWIATDGGGIFQAVKGDLTNIRMMNNGPECMSTTAMAIDKTGRVWAGSYGHGVFCSEGETFTQPDFVRNLTNNNIMCMEYDPNRNFLYVGTNGGRIDMIDLNKNQVRNIDVEMNKWIRSIHVDRTGRLWIGTAEGTYYYDVDHNKILNVNIGIARNYPTNALAEFDNKIYIGSTVGLIIYDMQENTTQIINQSNGLDDNNIMSIAIGNDKSLWITTPKSLSRMNLNTMRIRNYSSFEGFNIGEFRYSSVFKDKSGFLLFGGDNGLVKVDPFQVNRQQYKMRPIFFTEFNIHNKVVDYDESLKAKNILDAAISEAKRIRLSYKDNSFTICFSAQEFASPQKVNYSYHLNGFDNTWHYTDASNARATYANLPPGHYTFEVKGYFDEESKNVTTQSIRIIVANPWYSSILAKCLYLLLFVAILYFFLNYYKNKQEQRKQLEMAHYNEQVKEDKLRLFTSIAHEIRTPLTLVISPLKKLMGSVSDADTKEMYNLMYRNSLRILQTINQLLDVRKLDNRQLKLHFEERDLISVIKGIMLSFKNMATVKQVSFSMETSDSDHLNMWIDPLHFDKIIYNILSNAFKFTPLSGKILIRINCQNNFGQLENNHITEFAEIRIFNTGSPIEEEDLKHIFERFYQGNNSSDKMGSGVGLHLTYELVLLHHGSIEAHNIGSEGIEFVVRIPLGNAHLTNEELAVRNSGHEADPLEDKTFDVISEKDFVDNVSTLQDEEDEPKHKYSILIVDDDEEFCHYIKKELVDYSITVSHSGNKAWKQLLSNHPDVVVTDYLMPDGNGLELCQRIKSNPETDSIPVIILTSEGSENIQMQSMQQHADRFLTKPFNILMLKGAIGQSLRVREKIRNKIHRTEMGYNYDTMVIDSADDKLVKKVIEYIKEHLENSELSVEELSREVGFSRVHLNRKLKEILGISPSSLIKSIRLKQAAYLLVNNKVNISEVAYMVGFSSHSYFSYNFHAYFGMSPKEFIIYYTENADEESIRKLLE